MPSLSSSMKEQFELAQGARDSLPEAELDCHRRVINLCNAQTVDQSSNIAECGELWREKFIRLSSEYFPDVGGIQLKFLSELCIAACNSEKFFLSVARNQWIRTIIKSEKAPQELFSPTSTEKECRILRSNITIHSNILPCDPFWRKMQETRDDSSNCVHFPCVIFMEAIQEKKTLTQKLVEWRMKKVACEFGHHGFGGAVDGNSTEDPPRLF